jgi:cell wall assembly regulator SMI1
MNPNILKRLEDEKNDFPMLFGNPVSTKQIADAEMKLGISFCKDYSDFIELFGGAIVGPLPVFGLSKADEMSADFWSVLEVTLHYRRENWPGVEDWYVISIDHSGNPIGLDVNAKVIGYDHDTEDCFEVAPTFSDYINKLLDKCS